MAKVVKLISFNVNGLNGPVKRIRVYDYLKKLKTEIAFIQESHLTKAEYQKLKREWVGQVYASSFNSKARGAVILLHKNLPFSVEKNISDPAGRYVLIQGNMYSETRTFLNVYAPNYDNHSFI